jgi:hypothetical protein
VTLRTIYLIVAVVFVFAYALILWALWSAA